MCCVCYGTRVLGKHCDINLQKQGSEPANKEEQGSSGKQYGDLFTYTRSMQENWLGVTDFYGAKKILLYFKTVRTTFW